MTDARHDDGRQQEARELDRGLDTRADEMGMARHQLQQGIRTLNAATDAASRAFFGAKAV